MVIQLGFSLTRWLHIDTAYKGPKGGEVISLVCIFIDLKINYIRFWKGIGKLDIMV